MASDLNDIAVHEGLSEQIIDVHDASGKQREGRAKRAFAAGRLSGREEARVASVLKDAQLAYHAFAKAKPLLAVTSRPSLLPPRRDGGDPPSGWDVATPPCSSRASANGARRANLSGVEVGQI